MAITFRLTDVLSRDVLQQCARIVVENPPETIHQCLLREVVLPRQAELAKALDGLDPDWFAGAIEQAVRKALNSAPKQFPLLGDPPTT